MLTAARWFPAAPLALLYLLTGCAPTSGESLQQSTPVVVGIAYDITASTRNLPIPTEEQLDEVVSVVKVRGGIVAFGLIADKTEPLTRLELAPVAGRLDERARAAQKNRKAVAHWRDRVAAMLARPRDVRVTDFHGVIRQIDTLFRERTIPASAVKVALLITDATHTAKRNPRVQGLPEDVTVLAIGVERSLGGRLFGERVLYFEDIASAIKMLGTLAETPHKEA